MGDRTSVCITCRKEDKRRVVEFMYGGKGNTCEPDSETEVEGGAVELEFCEMNFAACDEIQEMVDAGLIFYGFHYSGCNYGPCVFICDGKEFIECSALHDIAGPAIDVDPNGSVVPDQYHNCIRYWQLLEKVKTLFGCPALTR